MYNTYIILIMLLLFFYRFFYRNVIMGLTDI